MRDTDWSSTSSYPAQVTTNPVRPVAATRGPRCTSNTTGSTSSSESIGTPAIQRARMYLVGSVPPRTPRQATKPSPSGPRATSGSSFLLLVAWLATNRSLSGFPAPAKRRPEIRSPASHTTTTEPSGAVATAGGASAGGEEITTSLPSAAVASKPRSRTVGAGSRLLQATVNPPPGSEATRGARWVPVTVVLTWKGGPMAADWRS